MNNTEKPAAISADKKVQINEHPILTLTIEQRKAEIERQSRMYLEFVNLMLKNLNYQSKLEKQLDDLSDTLLSQTERTNSRNAFSDAQILMQFDPEAFMDAIITSLSTYNPEHIGESGRQATFLTYFNNFYIKNSRKNTARMNSAVSIDNSDLKLLRRVDKYLKETFRDSRSLSDLTADELKTLTKAVKTTPKRMEQALRYYCSLRNPLSLDELPETDAAAHWDIFDCVDSVVSTLEAVCDADEQEYPRLFLSNDILSFGRENEDCCSVFTKYEYTLMNKVFFTSYLHFVFVLQEHFKILDLLTASEKEKLIDATIAKYMHVAKSTVSSKRTAYKELLHKISEHD